MEASKFIKEAIRMCGNYHCDDCPVDFGSPCISDVNSLADDDKALEQYISIVEKWSKEHPIITNSNKIEEVFGKDILHRFENVANNTKNEALGRLILDFLNGEYKEHTKKEINNGIHEN